MELTEVLFLGLFLCSISVAEFKTKQEWLIIYIVKVERICSAFQCSIAYAWAWPGRGEPLDFKIIRLPLSCLGALL